jgi:peptide/nickel transport system substrate-binding protein
LQQLAGYWPDIEKSLAEARRLLKEAGADGLAFELLNRTVDQLTNTTAPGSSMS